MEKKSCFIKEFEKSFVCYALVHVLGISQSVLFLRKRASLGVDLIKLFWRKFSHIFFKLNHFINANNNCLGEEERSSLPTQLSKFMPKSSMRSTPAGWQVLLFSPRLGCEPGTFLFLSYLAIPLSYSGSPNMDRHFNHAYVSTTVNYSCKILISLVQETNFLNNLCCNLQR